jgi:hypothetical protein
VSSEISGLFQKSLQNSFDEAGSGRTFDERKDYHLATRFFNPFPSHRGFLGPIPSFDKDVGLERGDEFQGGGFIKNSDIVHTPKARENLRPLFLREDGPVRAFQASNRMIAVHPDDQYISKRFRFLQIADMADMENVETTVGKNDPFSLYPKAIENPAENLSILNLFLQSYLLLKTYQI